MSLSPAEQLLETAIDVHLDAVAGEPGAAARATGLLERYRADNPDNPVANAYYGSSLALLSRDEPNPLDRLKLVQRALKLLDNAAAAMPDHIKIRKLRGKVSFELPEHYFHRTTTAIDDYLYLFERELNEPGTLPLADYERMIAELGDAFERIDLPKQAERCRKELLGWTHNVELRAETEQKLLAGADKARTAGKRAAFNPADPGEWIVAAAGIAGISLINLARRKL